MIDIVPYRPEHALAFTPVFGPEQYAITATPALAKAVEGPFARTAMLDGKPIACGGLTAKWLEYWIAWAYMSAEAGRHMLAITRAIQRTLPDLPKGRIEAVTPRDYAAGRRWLEMLGFKCETPDGMAHYTPDGRVFMQYARIN